MNVKSETSPRSANIFVNYRREDSSGHSGRLFDRLSQHFPGRVFMDIDTIEPGVDFAEVIEQAVGSCEVLIVVIGREWLHLKDATGRRRLDVATDFVRMEVAAALERNIRVIPVLVEGASMPRAEDLPPDLVRLSRRNAIELSDARWAFDVDRLIQTIERVLQEQAPAAPAPPLTPPSLLPEPSAPRAGESRKPKAWMAAAALLIVALAGWIGWRLVKPSAPQDAGKIVSSTNPVESAADPAGLTETPAETPPKVPQVQPDPTPVPQGEPSREVKSDTWEEIVVPQLEQSADFGPDTCKQGYVWREALTGDHVCVTPEVREATAEDNRQAEARRDPAGGPYGPDTCLSGYVWREAFEGDHVCVTPETRAQARFDNSQADERRMRSVVRLTKSLLKNRSRERSAPTAQ